MTHGPIYWPSIAQLDAEEAPLPDTHLSGGAAGRRYRLEFEDESTIEYRLDSDDLLHRFDGFDDVEIPCRSRVLRPHIVQIDYVDPEDPTRAITVLVDTERGIATEVEVHLRRRGEAGNVEARVSHGVIDGHFTRCSDRHRITADLDGRQMHFVAEDGRTGDHVYFKDHYAWSATAGGVRVAGEGECRIYRLLQNLYFTILGGRIDGGLVVATFDLEANHVSVSFCDRGCGKPIVVQARMTELVPQRR